MGAGASPISYFLEYLHSKQEKTWKKTKSRPFSLFLLFFVTFCLKFPTFWLVVCVIVSILKFFALLFNLYVNVYNCSNYCASKNFFERAMSAGISCKQVCGTWGGGGGTWGEKGGLCLILRNITFNRTKRFSRNNLFEILSCLWGDKFITLKWPIS